MPLFSIKKFIWACLFVFACAAGVFSQTNSARVRQPREVIDAYRVCERFENLLSENLDFDRAFEASFAKNHSRRREIAIAEGEFDRDNLTSVDTATLVDAFKSRMQILFLMFPLMGPETTAEEATFFPPKIREIFDRKPPEAAKDFARYALQLKRDAADMRAHLEQLARRDPRVAERIRDFKSDLAKEATLPDYAVKPLTAYSKGRVLGPKEEYYQIGAYAVIREGNEMRIIGMRFFRLF